MQAPTEAPASAPASGWHRRPALTAIPARRFLPGDHICPGLLACDPLSAGQRTERWLAWSASHWSRVVVKLPREEHMDDLRAVRRLAREARALRRLSHPAVPRLLDDGHEHPVPHLVLEHIEGLTLDQLLLTRGPLPAGEVVRLGVRLASCLHHVHGQGLVHLGMEPAGIAVRDGQATLLDFGAARPAGGSPPPGRPRGAAYQAPERCLRACPDPRMDLFSLGTVLYELATGQPAFRVEEVVPGCPHPQLLVAPVRARTLRADVPADLDAVIHALLERDPRRRPGTALEALRLLAAALPGGEPTGWPSFADEMLDAG
ncbi:MAG TPA: serine/threonine-protein kinase [Candidatus Dormibacteraeota bacterium]|nr:serine/threonine-protein kinase [Candidatus Dormibacteraeota bacterium]